MLQTVELRTADGGTLLKTLPLEAVDPNDTVVIKSITGLDPADVTIFKGDFSRDGGYYQGRRSSGRNPVMNLKLNPDWANNIMVSDIREEMYGILYEPSEDSDGLRMVLKDHAKPDRYLIGYTERSPADLFAKETDMQASLLCTDPFLKSVSTTAGADVAGWSQTVIPYDGSAKNGALFEFEVKTATAVMNLEVGLQKMTLNGNFLVGQTISINTEAGTRWIRQNGSDIMSALSAASVWARLRRGDNTVKSYGSVAGDGKVVLKNWTYRAAWWGV